MTSQNEPLSIRETLRRKNLNPAEKLVEIYEELEKDEKMFDDLIKDNKDLKAARPEVFMKTRTLKHKVLKDLVVAKQTEDDQLLKLDQIEREKKSAQGAKIPVIKSHQRKQLPDGRWVVQIDGQKENNKSESEAKTS